MRTYRNTKFASILQLLTHIGRLVPRLDGHVSEGAEGAQRFATKTKRFHTKQVNKLSYFGGMILGSFRAIKNWVK